MQVGWKEGTRLIFRLPYVLNPKPYRVPVVMQGALEMATKAGWKEGTRLILRASSLINLKPSRLPVGLQETLEVAIKPGWKEGTRLIFEGKGDHLPGRPPQDIVFVVRELPHPRFTRAGDDLLTEVHTPTCGLAYGHHGLWAGP